MAKCCFESRGASWDAKGKMAVGPGSLSVRVCVKCFFQQSTNMPTPCSGPSANVLIKHGISHLKYCSLIMHINEYG